MIDPGLVVLRSVVGLLLAAHGTQKLFGWFGGYGPRGTAAYLDGLGYRPGLLFAVIAGMGEVLGGLLLTLGLVTPIAGAIVLATMVNVYAGHAGRGLWNHEGGWELPLVYATVSVALAVTGPGAISLDARLGLVPWRVGWTIGALAIGFIAGLAVLISRRPAPAFRATVDPGAV